MLKEVAHENGTLHVRYNTGKVYSHPGVPAEKFKALVNAPSVGEYFNKHIKTQHPVSK